MLIACAQITSTADIQTNLEIVETQAQRASQAGCKMVVFPEATSQAFGTGRLDVQAQPLDGPFATRISELAQELGITIVVGMFTPADRQGKVNRIHNVAFVAGPSGQTHYNKIHTYDAFGYREKDTVAPGEKLVTFQAEGHLFGLAICYDIRFASQFRALATRGAEAIIVPTSWANGDGKLEQWRLLTAARALDSTSWIIAAGQALPAAAESEDNKRDDAPTGIGHSAFLAPNGTRVAEAGYGEELLIHDVDFELVEKVRKALPVLEGTDSY